MKLNPITWFIPQKLFRIVWDSDPSGFGILKCPIVHPYVVSSKMTEYHFLIATVCYGVGLNVHKLTEVLVLRGLNNFLC